MRMKIFQGPNQALILALPATPVASGAAARGSSQKPQALAAFSGRCRSRWYWQEPQNRAQNEAENQNRSGTN